MANIIDGSRKWQLVEERLKELRNIVEENWNNGEWQQAIYGERIIKTVEQSQAAAGEMRQRYNDLAAKINSIDPNNQ